MKTARGGTSRRPVTERRAVSHSRLNALINLMRCSFERRFANRQKSFALLPIAESKGTLLHWHIYSEAVKLLLLLLLLLRMLLRLLLRLLRSDTLHEMSAFTIFVSFSQVLSQQHTAFAAAATVYVGWYIALVCACDVKSTRANSSKTLTSFQVHGPVCYLAK